MELIKHVYVEENGKGYIKRAERDTRPVVDRLYGINIPAYPFTFDTMEKDLQACEIVNAESFLEWEEMVTQTIDETREDFKKQVAERFPDLEKNKQREAVHDLMKHYVLGVFGAGRDVHTLDAETENILYSSDAFMWAFVIHRLNKLKEGHAVIKMLMLKRVIYPMCSAFTFSADYEHLYLLDEANTERYTFDFPIMIDVTEDVYNLLVDYGSIHETFCSLGDYVKNAYRGTENDIEAGVHNIADALTHILLGFTDNDCIRIDVARTGRQHMNKLLEKAIQKHTGIKETLILAQVMADDVLAQKNAQNATGADF